MNTFIKQHKIKFIILDLALLFAIIAIAYYIGTTTGQKPVIASLSSGPNAVVIDASFLNSFQQYNFETVEQGYFTHHCFTDLYFSSVSTSQEFPAWNDPVNDKGLIVTLYLATPDEVEQASGEPDPFPV